MYYVVICTSTRIILPSTSDNIQSMYVHYHYTLQLLALLKFLRFLKSDRRMISTVPEFMDQILAICHSGHSSSRIVLHPESLLECASSGALNCADAMVLQLKGGEKLQRPKKNNLPYSQAFGKTSDGIESSCCLARSRFRLSARRRSSRRSHRVSATSLNLFQIRQHI